MSLIYFQSCLIGFEMFFIERVIGRYILVEGSELMFGLLQQKEVGAQVQLIHLIVFSLVT